MTEWISIKNRLPENETHVLVYDKDRDDVYVGYFYDNTFDDGRGTVTSWITHWMPLPPFPEPYNENK